ncbi:serine hydrolase [Plantactinospora mayteni]|uniref:Serine hydrolase n=1 Tax=Plantactinospora mayteni TaxID=566021 RepID=A0ABQ4ESX9_9ACTN|nr:hypothetical protein [Plantactinospora mayteni]GIG97768.1 hypothetical protein Pma05_43410 [Plantactinospora mayteni]
MRSRLVLVLAVVSIVLGGALLVLDGHARFPAVPGTAFAGSGVPAASTPPPPPPPPPTLVDSPVSVKVDGFFAWALLDRESEQITGSANSARSTNSTESMIKIWIVSDFLRRTASAGNTPSDRRLRQASQAIRNSSNDSAEALYDLGGRTAVIERMISRCGLTNTRASTRPGYVGWWSFTEMSAQDAVRLGECVKSGRAAGSEWTKWVLREMRNVWGTTAERDQQATREGGRWGIIDGLPDELLETDPVSIKNGWTSLAYDGKWHVNCLAVSNKWVLAVQTRYPDARGLDYGARICASVASQLVTPKPEP